MRTRKTSPRKNAVSRRSVLQAMGGAAIASRLPSSIALESARPSDSTKRYDLIVVGGGNSGMPAAIFASRRGARVLIIEAAPQLGGTLFLSSGQMAAAGTKLQKSKGIVDTPQLHYDDVMRISKGTANPELTRLAVENNGATFDWLTDNGLVVHPEHPETGTTHEPYSQPRYAWGMEGGLSILKILTEQIQPEIDKGHVTVLTSTKARELITDKSGAVVGVRAAGDSGALTSYLARNTLLTSGGFASNPVMFQQIDHLHDYNDDSYPFSQGEGIALGVSAGGYVRNGELHAPLFGGILSGDKYPSHMLQIFRPWPPSRPPYEIFVNDAGERFLQEDVPSHDVYEESLLKQPNTVCWVVFDDAIFNAAPAIMNPQRWSHEQYAELFNSRKFFSKADTLQDLAALAGIAPAGLVATVANYNEGQASGHDRLGRKHLPLPIAKPPFYAIKLHSWKFMGFGGLTVDNQLRVVRKDGTPIGNLYAAGEMLGSAVTMGHSHCGGMCVTPALTFGRLLGQKMLPISAA